MNNVDIEVFPIAKTSVDRAAVECWLKFIGVSDDYQLPGDEVTDPALLIALAAKRCYKSFEPGLNPNVTKVRRDWAEYLDNVLKSGHGSVFEHSVYTFAIENISRVFTAELNRHRAGVGISEGSMRYIRFDNISWWMPPSIKITQEEMAAAKAVDDYLFAVQSDRSTPALAMETVALAKLAEKKEKSQQVFNRHYGQTELNYSELQSIWADELAPTSKFHGKKQVTSMMRRIIPMGVATGGVWTMNARAVRHIIAMRASEAAEEEIAHVFGKIAKVMVEDEPMLMGDFEEVGGFWKPKYVKV